MAPIFIGPRQATGVLVSGSRNAIDMTARLPVTCTGSMVFARTVGRWSSIPSILGMLGPWKSRSSRPTFFPWLARAYARFTETVDLPTPPFPLRTRMTCRTSIFAFGGSPFGALCGCTGAQVLQFSGTGLFFRIWFWCHGISIRLCWERSSVSFNRVSHHQSPARELQQSGRS